MAPYILILAHLAGDFLFQPGNLIAWKQKSWLGIFVHVSIIFAINVLLFWPYWDQILLWQMLVVLTTTHFIQDWVKVFYEAHYNEKQKAYPFFVDQFLHILVIFFVGGYLTMHLKPVSFESSFLEKLFFNQNLYVYASFLILFSYTLDIVIYQIRRHRNPKLKYHRHYEDMSKRIFAFAVVYAVFLVVSSGAV